MRTSPSSTATAGGTSSGYQGLPSLILDRIERGELLAVNEPLACHGVGQVWQLAMLQYLE